MKPGHGIQVASHAVLRRSQFLFCPFALSDVSSIDIDVTLLCDRSEHE